MIQLDEQTANAVESIVRRMPNEWAIVEDYIARSLCVARDQMESGVRGERDEKSGVCQGLRHLFELHRKAFNFIENKGPKQGIDKEIVGETEYVINNNPHGEDL